MPCWHIALPMSHTLASPCCACRSIHSADELLLAWYHRNASQVFAVLTADSDFYIYGRYCSLSVCSQASVSNT